MISQIVSQMILHVFWCLILFSSCDCSDVFHEASKITFHPNFAANFFGYAVAFGEKALVVGAPKATTPGSPITTGVVFNCPLQNLRNDTRNISCTPLNVKTNGFSNGMWFGASLAVGPTGKMVICAPRWTRSTREAFRSGMNVNGACYLRTKRLDTLLSPFNDYDKQVFIINNSRTEYADYHFNADLTSIKYYGLAQAGMAAKITGDTIIIGAPGLLVWSGGVVQYTYNPDEKSVKNIKRPTYNPFFTPDVHPDEYFGYAVESGVFEAGGKTLYVAGGPKGKRGFGMVLVFEPATEEEAPLNILTRLEGPQLGSYFGASLSCLDINADGRTDLLVGAPNYVNQFPKDDVYDQGAVFVYLNERRPSGFILNYAGRVTGSKANGAKFGYSIANLGDIDGDGYNDVAISAPWENNGAGAVYVYTGNKYGLEHKHEQKIVASEARGFGMALAEGDMDYNKCNDLIVGAHETGAAYLYRCIPTVKVQAAITIPAALTLQQNTKNFTAQFCVSVQPLGVQFTVLGMDLQATVIIDPVDTRATIAENSMYTYHMSTVPSRSDICGDQIIKIKPGADLSRPISIKYDLVPINTMQDDYTKFLTHAWKVSKDSNLHATLNIQLVQDCGKDLICTPWLEMILEAMNDPYIPGTDGRLGAIVKVLNKEEPAFGIRVNLTLPSLPKRVPMTCNLQGLNLTCDLPSPFNQNESAVWDVEFEYTPDMREIGITTIDVAIDDPVPNRVISDNSTQYLEIGIMPVANISATGKALPNATVTVSRDKFNAGDQIPFIHYYQVSNAGPSDWPELTATIIVPAKGSPMLKEIAGCAESWDSGNLTLACNWSVQAKHSFAVVLSLRYDLAANGKSFEENKICNITSTLFLHQQNINLSLTTMLVLDPVSVLWVYIIVGVIVGLLLLAILCYTLYKLGFFSRVRWQAHKELRHASLLEDSSCSSSNFSPKPMVSDNSRDDPMKSNCSPQSDVLGPTVSNFSDRPSELDNSLPPLTFQGPNEPEQIAELVCFNLPTNISEATAFYVSIQKQLETDPYIK